MRTFLRWLEDFRDHYPINQWVTIDADTVMSDDGLAMELSDLINLAYASIGGHANIKSPEDLRSEFSKGKLTFIKAIDNDEIPGADAISGYMSTQHGNKSVVIAAKPTNKDSKDELISLKTGDMSERGNYAEVSGPIAKRLLDRGVPVVDSEKAVRMILRGKNIAWHGSHPDLSSEPPNVQKTFGSHDGWYTRSIGGHDHVKIMVGLPNTTPDE